MSRYSGKVALFVAVFGFWCFEPIILAQQASVAGRPPATSGLSTDQALALAEQGHCQENLSALKRVMYSKVPAETRKRAGVVGLRCSLTLEDHDSTADFIRLLRKQFARDPEVLFILVHAYSDLSTRAAQDLGRTAPQSIPAHKLNAEALEMQGKWGPAQLEYEGIIANEPNAPGIHFLLGRLLLSRPDAGPDAPERAKQEFQKELEVDPNNSGAHYVLGELARRDEKWDEAISQFSQAAKFDSNFSEAYLGWGVCLVAVKRYQDAIPPLRTAERLTPGNPAVHHALATAFERSGQKEEAEREFAIHRSLDTITPRQPAPEKPR
jgi:tetratricopeptide (TPR) repeat protein